MNLTVNKIDYIKLLFEFLCKTEGYGTEYQYAYMISVLFFNGDIRYANRLCEIVDLDVLDTSVMSGTGTPETGGMSFNELVGWFEYLKNFD